MTSALIPMINTVNSIAPLKEDDCKFLVAHKEHFTQIMLHTHMWRTDIQKRSILNDIHFPTLHSKFHQAMLEQKVQLDQTFYLAKDFEEKKLEIEELHLDLEELGDSKRDEIKRRKLTLQVNFKEYEIGQMKIALDYRMEEVKGWQVLQEQLLTTMRESGMDEETIWSKNAGEIESQFFLTLNKLQGLKTTTDSAEASNLVALAQFAVQQAREIGKLSEWKARCSPAQLDSLKLFGI